MKKFSILFLTSFVLSLSGKAQDKKEANKPFIVEASCGQCNFGLKEPGCSLAIKFENKAYFVDGSGIDDHGDAHAADGFCTAIRKAEVSGEIVDNRFKLISFKLLDEPKKLEHPKKKQID